MISPALGEETSGSSFSSSRSGMYESPFLDMTSMYMPKTMKELFKYITCVVYSDGLVAQCIAKLAEYPITRLSYTQYKKEFKGSGNKWKTILEDYLDIDTAMKQSGYDYYAYGTSLISISFPFKRVLQCNACEKESDVNSVKDLKFKSYKYYGVCPECNTSTMFVAKDMNTKEEKKLRYIFWDLNNTEIKYNNVSGDHFFYYNFPKYLKNKIGGGDIDFVNSTRLEIIEAIEKNKKLKLSNSNLFHYKRIGPQTINDEDRGWGVPVVMSVLKDIFYKRVLRKANEAIAFDHILPLRFMFPAANGDVSPHASTNLGTWRNKIEEEIRLWRKDPNRISIMPLPVGQINFGGDGKALMVTQEIRAVEDDIITGIGIIPEIIRGGASWSGSNVSLRVVENTHLNHRNSMQSFIDWTVNSLSHYLSIPSTSVSLSPFKMADDMTRKTTLLQAASNSTVSHKTALSEFDISADEEYENILEETKRRMEIKIQEAEGVAEAQGVANVIAGRFSADAQHENASRAQMHQRKDQAKRDKEQSVSHQEAEAGLKEEVGQDMNLPNVIMSMTSRFASLAKYDIDEFKIRMLSLKNSMPNMYKVIYDNLREMNLIEADTNPDLEQVQKYTPGEIPQNYQGDIAAETPATPSESGQSVMKPLPEVMPPRGSGATI